MEQLIQQFYSLHTVLLLACVVFYFKAADFENAPRLLWTGLSVLVFLLTWLVFGWGLFGCLIGQALLLVGIAVGRVVREMKRTP